MLKVMGVTFTDEAQEAMLDAVDRFGVYQYLTSGDGVVFVSFYTKDSLLEKGTDAVTYLRDRCSGVVWVDLCEEWLNEYRVEAVTILCGSEWRIGD